MMSVSLTPLIIYGVSLTIGHIGQVSLHVAFFLSSQVDKHLSRLSLHISMSRMVGLLNIGIFT